MIKYLTDKRGIHALSFDETSTNKSYIWSSSSQTWTQL